MGKKKDFDRTPLSPDNEQDAIVLDQMGRHSKMHYSAFKALIDQGAIQRLCKLKHPKTIFFDEETQMFCYFNPYHRALSKCGMWKEDLES